jgi:hypothetical protein
VRYMHRYMQVIILVIAAQFFISCAARHYRTYDAPPKPKNEIAMLVGIYKLTSFKNEDIIVQIVSIDQKTGFRGSRWDGEYKIELLPGVHEVGVRYRGYGYTSTTPITLTYHFEPGQTYVVKPNLSQRGRHWSPSIVNITKD